MQLAGNFPGSPEFTTHGRLSTRVFFLLLLPSPEHVCACARWNQLDLAIVLLSVMGITLEEIEINAALPINPTIIRIMRVLRIARGTQHVLQILLAPPDADLVLLKTLNGFNRTAVA